MATIMYNLLLLLNKINEMNFYYQNNRSLLNNRDILSTIVTPFGYIIENKDLDQQAVVVRI